MNSSEEKELCDDCKKTENLGKWLSKAEYLIEVYDEKRGISGLSEQSIDFPVLNMKYYLLSDLSRIKEINAVHVAVYKLNSTEFLHENYNNCSFGFKFSGGAGYVKDTQDTPLNFSDLANDSKGLKRMGILRMDVDNLGLIFTKGLGKGGSVSRVTALSRYLTLFFSGYLNTLCQQDKYREKILIVYSGGDDLFVVGAWDKVIELAEEINREFREFTCHNPSFTLSGGIAMTGEKISHLPRG